MARSSGVKDIWTQIQDKIASDPTAAARIEGVADTHVLVVGSKNSGKSHLLLRFKKQSQNEVTKEDTKPTVALEYSYRVNRNQNNVKQVAHLWELGGGLSLERLTTNCITPENVALSLGIIVLDLSDPPSILETVYFWIDKIRTLVANAVKGLSSRGLSIPERISNATTRIYGADHVDREKVDPIGIPLIIVGAKYDAFLKAEAESAKAMARFLRFMAHMNGAAVVYTSKEMQPFSHNFVQLLNHYAFTGPMAKNAVTDHLKPLLVPAGSDTFQSIGRAPSNESDIAAWRREYITSWKNAFITVFSTATTEKDEKRTLVNAADPEFKEPLVDEARAVKDKNLELYRIEYEKKVGEERARAERLTREQLDKATAAVRPSDRTSAPSGPRTVQRAPSKKMIR